MVFETKLSLASNSSYLALVWIECQIRRSQVPWAFLVAQMVKNLPAMWEPWVGTGLGRSPGGGHDNPLWYSCMKNPHGQRSLMSYRPCGHKELGMTEQLSTHRDWC